MLQFFRCKLSFSSCIWLVRSFAIAGGFQFVMLVFKFKSDAIYFKDYNANFVT